MPPNMDERSTLELAAVNGEKEESKGCKGLSYFTEREIIIFLQSDL